MHLRIAGTTNAKIAQRANFVYQLVSVLKILLCRELKVPGNIPPQGQNILNAVLLQLRYHLMNFIPGRGQAGQMRSGVTPSSKISLAISVVKPLVVPAAP